MSLRHSPFFALAILALSHPLVAAHRGNSLAWIGMQRDARNVWVASAPSWQGRQITKYADDGQEIESLTFTPDGRSVVYVRGGAPNRAGERPNPSLIPGADDFLRRRMTGGSSASTARVP
jgi:hypothetical protein